MKIKRTIPLLALLVLAGVLAALAPAAPGSSQASLVIRHQQRGCHSWSLNGGAYRTNQAIVIRRGGSVRVMNLDVMPHKLVETSGPAVVYKRLNVGGMMGLKGTFPPAMMAHMRATTSIVQQGRQLPLHHQARRGLHGRHQDHRRGQRPPPDRTRQLEVGPTEVGTTGAAAAPVVLEHARRGRDAP